MAWFRMVFLLLLSLNSYAAIAPMGRAYVTMATSSNIGVIDITTDTLLYKIALPNNSGPAEAIAITSDGSKLYVGCLGDNKLRQINTITNEVSEVLSVMTYGMAINSKGIAYIASFNTNAVFIFDTKTNQLIGTITSSQFVDPASITISEDEKFAYVTNYHGPTVSQIDLITNTVVNNALTVGLDPDDVALTKNGQTAYVACQESSQVAVINYANRTVSTLPYFISGVQDVCLSPDDATLYAPPCIGTPSLPFIDTASGVLVKNLSTPRGSGFLATNRDGSKIYMTSGYATSAYVTVVNSKTQSISTEISLNDTSVSPAPNLLGIVVYDPDQNLRLIRVNNKYDPVKPTKGSLR